MHGDEPACSPPRSRKRRMLAWSLVVLAAVLGGIFLYLHLTVSTAWEAAVADAVADDPAWRWDELQARRKIWPDGENGALVARGVKSLIPPLWPAWDYPVTGTPGNPAPLAGDPANPRLSEQERQALQQSFQELKAPHQLHERQLAVLREEFLKVQEALTEARRLSGFPHGRFPIHYNPDILSTLLTEIQDARAVANLLSYDVLLRLQEKDTAAALHSCQAMLHLCGYFNEEPTLTAMLVRLAIRSLANRSMERLLAQSEFDEHNLAVLQKLVEAELAQPIQLWAFRGERAYNDHAAEQLESGRTPANLAAGAGGGFQALTLLMPGGMRKERTALLQVNNRFVRVVQLPPAERRAAEVKLEQEASQLPVLARLLVPSLLKVSEAENRSRAETRCAAALLAAERYRLANGRWPQQLADLVPRYLSAVPEDPFASQPLRYRLLEDCVVIYSVSLNNKDDRGVKLSFNIREVDSDLGLRLYDVPHRRQSARALQPAESK